MMEMNTTPLIDVMLVLLIMLIMTMPSPTHSVGLALPQGTPPVTREINSVTNEITLDRGGQARWNGDAVGDPELRGLLVASARMATPPEIHFRPDANARYERVDQILAMTSKAGVRRFGFVGNEGYGAIF